MSNLVIPQWRHFEYKVKFEKRPVLFNSEIGVFDIFFKRICEKVLKIYISIVIENFKPMSLCLVFVQLHRSPLLISNIVKGAV